MVGEWRIKGACLSCVSANGFHPNTEDIALSSQEKRAVFVKTGRVGAIGLRIQEGFAGCAIAPASAQQYPGSGGNTTMLALPGQQTLRGEQEVRILLDIGGDIDDAG